MYSSRGLPCSVKVLFHVFVFVFVSVSVHVCCSLHISYKLAKPRWQAPLDAGLAVPLEPDCRRSGHPVRKTLFSTRASPSPAGSPFSVGQIPGGSRCLKSSLTAAALHYCTAVAEMSRQLQYHTVHVDLIMISVESKASEGSAR